MVTALRHDPVLLREREEEVRLLDRVGDRLLHVHVDAALHGEERRQGVLLLVRGDDHRVDAVAHLLEQLVVRRERGNLLVSAAGVALADARTRIVERGFVGIDERHDLLALALGGEDVPHPQSAPDERHANLASGGDRARTRRVTDVEERQRRACGCQTKE